MGRSRDLLKTGLGIIALFTRQASEVNVPTPLCICHFFFFNLFPLVISYFHLLHRVGLASWDVFFISDKGRDKALCLKL